jgi:cytochrome c553
MTRIQEYLMYPAIAVLIIYSIIGCSTANDKTVFDPVTGKHVASWMTSHGPTYLTDQTTCVQCHGNDLQGGISHVSCFSASFGGASCHQNGPGHPNPVAWGDPAQHGASAKSSPNPAAMAGFAVCEICHGANFLGSAYSPACDSCHGGTAPHPVSWITATYTHTNTNPGNAPVCALCHLNGANSPIAPPSPPVPAGTAPGCFNNSLCHASIHPVGWSAATSHGAAAKLAPNASTVQGFSTCQTCHGSNFTGGTSNTACASCHGGSAAPHPTSWLPDSTYKHNTTNSANAGVCALCHINGALSPISPPSPPAPAGTAPGCTNGTLCHYNP